MSDTKASNEQPDRSGPDDADEGDTKGPMAPNVSGNLDASSTKGHIPVEQGDTAATEAEALADRNINGGGPNVEGSGVREDAADATGITAEHADKD